MALSCPINLDVDKLQTEIRTIYAQVATAPDGEFHFHRGPSYAAEVLGYDAEELAQLPEEATASFAGVANPIAIAPIESGQVVLDIGSGAGMDLLLAARRTGPEGRAIGVDMTDGMLERAKRAAAASGMDHVELRKGNALDLPADDGSVDVVISNGVINLVPDKAAAFAEVFRILKSGGRMLLGDIVVGRELSEGARNDIDLWTG
jgi:arsenite methyltransferase